MYSFSNYYNGLFAETLDGVTQKASCTTNRGGAEIEREMEMCAAQREGEYGAKKMFGK